MGPDAGAPKDGAAGGTAVVTVQFQRFGTNAGPIGNDEITKAEQRFVFFPHGNVEEGVCADDKKNSIAGSVVGVAKITNGIN